MGASGSSPTGTVPGTAARAALVLLVLGAASDAVWLLGRGPLAEAGAAFSRPGGLAQLPVDHALRDVCAAALVGCWAWLAACTVLVVADIVVRALRPGARTVPRLGPPALRRLVLLACGASLGCAVVGPANADPQHAAPSGPQVSRPASLVGLELPDRAVGGAPHPVGPARVVVRPGDSLWRIAERRLPTSAPPSSVARAWHRIRRANAGRLGPDPDLILPGTVLRVPRLLADPHDSGRHERKPDDADH